MKVRPWGPSFTKDFARAEQRGYPMHKLHSIVDSLAGASLPPSARPHRLRGEWDGFWECHVSFDWLLIYRFADGELILVRTGTHRDLFGE